MKKFFRNIMVWILLKIQTIMTYVGIALYNTEVDILKANSNNLSESKKSHRRWFSNSLLEKFYAGQTDEKYVQQYYELLKKADKFMREAIPHQMAVAADKYSMSLGRKDKYGRRYDHIGFFMDGHKYVGKTMGEVLKIEMEERRIKDDDYELLYIFNNKPIEVGLSEIEGYVDEQYNLIDLKNKSKILKFPLKIVRGEKVLNKIEQLSLFMHVKKIGFEHRLLEFLIPKKFNINSLKKDSEIFKQIINFEQVYIKNDYGELIGFTIKNFDKLISVEDFDVLKFHAIEMETITLR